MLSEHLRLRPGPVDLASYPTDATPHFEGSKKDGERRLAALWPRLNDAQTKLFAEGRSGGPRRVLLVLQGMDTAGKGGTVIKTLSGMNPSALRVTPFAAPTRRELAHDFLWRIKRAVPPAGTIGAFDRSHYEDVLIQRVHQMAPAEEIERRYGAIVDFERDLAESGTTLIKCMLHISPAEQKQRLQARLDDPTKYWKYNPSDVDERQHWDEYARAYEIALERTDTHQAPWFVVPSDRKWYRNLAVATLLMEALDGMDLGWPAATFDIEAEKARLAHDTIGVAR